MSTLHCVVERTAGLATLTGDRLHEAVPPVRQATDQGIGAAPPVFPVVAVGTSHWGEVLSELMQCLSRDKN
ncbi:MAG: hypothetical protein H7838_01410 [Magnetococcus sp. DMHC-8]